MLPSPGRTECRSAPSVRFSPDPRRNARRTSESSVDAPPEGSAPGHRSRAPSPLFIASPVIYSLSLNFPLPVLPARSAPSSQLITYVISAHRFRIPSAVVTRRPAAPSSAFSPAPTELARGGRFSPRGASQHQETEFRTAGEACVFGREMRSNPPTPFRFNLPPTAEARCREGTVRSGPRKPTVEAFAMRRGQDRSQACEVDNREFRPAVDFAAFCLKRERIRNAGVGYSAGLRGKRCRRRLMKIPKKLKGHGERGVFFVGTASHLRSREGKFSVIRNESRGKVSRFGRSSFSASFFALNALFMRRTDPRRRAIIVGGPVTGAFLRDLTGSGAPGIVGRGCTRSFYFTSR